MMPYVVVKAVQQKTNDWYQLKSMSDESSASVEISHKETEIDTELKSVCILEGPDLSIARKLLTYTLHTCIYSYIQAIAR